MSQAGQFTPLQLNLLAELSQGNAFAINPTLAAIIGVYNPAGYIQGSFTNNNFLQQLTAAIPNCYQLAVAGVISVATFRNLISISIDVCSALANGRSNTFNPSYPGWGSWQGGTQVSDMYPPQDYPNTTTYSYIGTDYGQYAYLTGWPGVNAWQQPTDTYMAAQPPSDLDAAPTTYDEYFSNGFIAQIAQQAYYEMWTAQFNPTNNITSVFQQSVGTQGQTNGLIASIVNGASFQSGNYSNMNDLTTNNISGVNQSFNLWGDDLINTGKAIDLSNIYRFGTPSVLLLTLKKYGAFTPAVGLALQYAGLTSQDVNSILTPTYIPTAAQETQIYQAFTTITGSDLYGVNDGITVQLNCRLNNLNTLADLLDPQMLFPQSYLGLTVPQYTATETSSKIYYLIYQDGGVNPQVAPLGGQLTTTLAGIMPQDIATACGAFAMSMQQITNIMQCPIEKFALTVKNLELTDLNLTLTTSTGSPVDVQSVNSMLNTIAFGSGSSGQYRECDFFGAACGYPYIDLLTQAITIINQLPTEPLQTIYHRLYVLSLTPIVPPPSPVPAPSDPILDAEIQAQIDLANAAIAAINTTNPQQVQQLNAIWNQIGNQLYVEQRSIPFSIPQTSNVTETQSMTNLQGFVSSIDSYAQDNSAGGQAPVLEGIADLTTAGGNALVAALREARNAQQLQWAGAGPQNDVSNQLDPCTASAVATLDDNGSIIDVQVTCGSIGYTITNPPQITIYPPGFGGVLAPVIQPDGSISAVAIIEPGIGYQYCTLVFDPPPQCVPNMSPGNTEPPPGVPQPTFPGTSVPGFAANPWVPGRIPPLPPPPTASPTIPETVALVTTANCDCWNV